MHPLCLRSDIRDSSASSVKHPMFPLCVCFEIAPDNPLLSAFNREASDNPFYILSLFVLFSFCFLDFRQFCRFLEWMKSEAAKPEKVLSSTVSFLYTSFVHRSVRPGYRQKFPVSFFIFVLKYIGLVMRMLICRLDTIYV